MKSSHYQWLFTLLSVAVAVGLLMLSARAVKAVRNDDSSICFKKDHVGQCESSRDIPVRNYEQMSHYNNNF